ncbi:MAG TPA: hypothetical protein VFO39_04115 [Candidatus Sulfotelmatobacter sp.]|nr:hypothetical protein [Candidatus Sulfotelmatobacter sp.]
MRHRAIQALFLLVSAVCAIAITGWAQEKPFDPIRQLLVGFPKTVELKHKGELLEFCPDNTCDGFVSKEGVSVATLKDFAYLYVYFYSDFTYLGDWRATSGARSMAERVLSKPEYRDCRKNSDGESARCVLQDLSRGEKIRLIFIRYDEGQRNVVPENIAEELARKTPASKQ